MYAFAKHPCVNSTLPASLPAGLRTWFERTRDRGKKSFRDRTVFDWFAAFLPCLTWLRTYKIKEYLVVCVEVAQGTLSRGAGNDMCVHDTAACSAAAAVTALRLLLQC